MAKLKLTYINVLPAIILLVCFESASAQRSLANDGATNTPASQTAVLDSRHKQELYFVVRVAGSISGRVFDETGQGECPQTATAQGIRGVKVTLRSRDPGFERFMIEQFTDTNGRYDFQDLRPGKYLIEIDPASLPGDYRTREAEGYDDELP